MKLRNSNLTTALGPSEQKPVIKISQKREHERIRSGEAIRTSNLTGIHSQGPSEQKPIKNFGKKGVWVYPRTTLIFGYPQLSQERYDDINVIDMMMMMMTMMRNG